jgi:hypothetical protein
VSEALGLVRGESDKAEKKEKKELAQGGDEALSLEEIYLRRSL